MNVRDTPLPDVKLIEPDVFGDERGYFMESWNQNRYTGSGIDATFRQANLSSSRRGVLRGLHFQQPHPQGKLVQVLTGEVFDVAVDIRIGSPTFGRWWGTELTGDNHRQLWVPAGFAHGFCVLSERAMFAYLCTVEYDPEADRCLRFDDPGIAIDWPVSEPELSEKDATAPLLEDLLQRDLLPRYEPRAS